MGKTFNAVSNLVVMGRNRGLGVTLINQRAATINKDVLTQIDTLLAFRNVSPQDRKALKEWVEYHAAEGDFEKFMASLPFLPTGEGWIWSPEFLKVFEKIKIRERHTFHPDREKLGDHFAMPTLDQTDIQAFIEAFQSSAEEVKAKKIQLVEVAKKDNPELIALRNDYESRLMQKDIEIRKLNSLLDSIRKLVGVPSNGIPQGAVSQSNLSMWLEKLGNSGASRILKILSQKSGMKFTRSQVALAVGMSHVLKRRQLLNLHGHP